MGEREGTQRSPVKYNKRNLLIVLVVLAVISFFTRSPSYEPSEWDGDTARSTFLGIQFTMPAGWSRDGEEALRAAEEQSGRERAHWDFTVRSDTDGSSVSLVVEKTTETAEEYLEQLLADGGTRTEPQAIGPANFEGVCLREGQEERYVFCQAVDSHLVSVLVTVPAGGDVRPLLDCFAALDGPT